MAYTNAAIFPQIPITEIATLTAPSAITARTNIVGTTGLVQLTSLPVTQSKRVDSIVVKSKGTSIVGQVYIWLYNGTTSFLYDEIDITALTPSTSVDSFTFSKSYLNSTQGSVILTTTQQLFISISTVQDVTVFATTGQY